MKKLCILGLAVLVAACFAGTAYAGINGTAHANTINRGGVDAAGCGQCHLPHAGQGDRLWPVAPGTSTDFVGAVAPLCGYCHHLTTPVGTLGAQQDLVYDLASHGYQMNWSDDTSGYVQSISQSGLPYTTAALGRTTSFIECTSCHNVHDDTNRPFLRDSMDQLCARCHMDRHFVGGALSEGAAPAAGAWGGNAYFGTGNPGSHPVGTDVTGNNFGGDTPVSIPGYMSLADGGVATGWSLGGKTTALSTTGGVTCVTCHAVHGLDKDAQDTVNSAFGDTQLGPYTNFLVREQNAATPRTDGRSVANGQSRFNALCEACHVGTQVDATAYPSANGDYDTNTDYSRISQNPGGTAFGHPVDNMDVTDQAWVTSFPAGWPTGNPTAAGLTAAGVLPATPTPICESCHAPHPYADRGEADLNSVSAAGSTDYILRGTAGGVCDGCHSGAGSTASNHHPVGRTFQGDNLTYLGFAAGDNTLECGTCHGGSGNGAHNWGDVAQLGMRAGWKPSNNGRSSTMVNDQYNAQMSITCMDCHLILTTTARFSPTLADGTGEANYDTIGDGSHYIGAINAGAGYWTAMGGAQNAYTYTGWNGDGAYSRFGGDSANPVLVCESCHELQPSMNAGNSHLLLASYTEELAVNRNTLCENCHYPAGTHPITGVTVSRTGALLSTSTAAAWLSAPTDPNIILRAGDVLNCDTCHQPHDANTNSYTYILDTQEAYVGTPTAFDANPTETVAGSYTSAYVSSIATSPGGVTTLFCNECHPYN